ncbi:PadR family transcriptional regulator [Paenarthrobacter ilicis]|uniref:PadR family transcriptional regulator PadR n=1 Tax=Paenarthrobacter ilicis TaxID=43665 RepID=A0ABX0TEA8_9MICC|nr:PadR family transcriptional regulator [Paenarthrobacter ilicis]MBM7792470.1 PadR family transcriptional regulator PadR [Paenarthrobacter ilicis]NIJ00814.1 PadR family transcriptional regulator PadR [Paenarthrobacter ilicis]
MNVSQPPRVTPADGDWPSDWLRATLGFLALNALASGPSYGYAIISELEHHGFGTIKGGTLYPLLTRYEAAGLVTTEWRAGDGGPGRKYFALTDSGRSEMNRLAADWRRFTELSNAYLNHGQNTKEIRA